MTLPLPIPATEYRSPVYLNMLTGVPLRRVWKTSLGERGRCLPRELRIKLYDEDVELRRKSLSYREIIDQVQRKHGVRLSKSHLSYWLRQKHSPYNGRYVPSIDLLRPSEELAYVIGVKLGNEYTTKKRRAIKGHNKIRIGLKVKNREFSAEFSICLANVLDRRPIKPRYRKSLKRYVVEVRSETFYQLLKKPVDLDRLKKYIEHCGKCMAAFVRRFTDSEGCVNRNGYISIYNTDLRSPAPDTRQSSSTPPRYRIDRTGGKRSTRKSTL